MKRGNDGDQASKKHFRFTDAALRKLHAPTTRFNLYYDTETAGLCLRIMKPTEEQQAGSRIFVLRYRTPSGKERYASVGRFSMTKEREWSVSGARKRASEMKESIRLGRDPLDEARAEREAQTVQDVIDRYCADILPKFRPTTQSDFRHLIAHDFGPIAKVRLKELSFRHVDGWFRKMSKRAPVRANLAHSVLRRMCNLAIKWGWLDKNPCVGIERNHEQKRHRYLNGAEVANLTAALANHSDQQAADIIRMLLFTGCRRAEAQGARWSDFDLTAGTWTKSGSTTKQRTMHHVPLSAPALELLSRLRQQADDDAEFVFPAPRSASGHRIEIAKDWRRLCKVAGIKDARLHDLRHSFASMLAGAGFSLPTIGALLGHSNPSTTSRYSHLANDPLREAVQRVGAIITGSPAAQVVPLRGAKQ